MTHRFRDNTTQPSQFLRFYDPETLLREAQAGDPASIAILISNTPLEGLDELYLLLNIDPTNLDEHGDVIVN